MGRCRKPPSVDRDQFLRSLAIRRFRIWLAGRILYDEIR